MNWNEVQAEIARIHQEAEEERSAKSSAVPAKNGNGSGKHSDDGAVDEKLAFEWAAAMKGHFLFAEGDEWWEYDGEKWFAVSASTVRTQVVNWLQQRKRVAIRSRRIAEMVAIGSTRMGDTDRPLPRPRFNATGMIPVANGMLEVETRKLLPHSPVHLNTYCLPYSYDASATCPRFKQFLREVMLCEDGGTCQEWVETLVEWMGYCLIPDRRSETVLVNIGEGSNGKSTWLTVLEGLVGASNCVAISPRRLERDPDYAMADLYGKLVGFLNEPTKTDLQGCSGSLKAVVSGDPVSARPPYGQPFTYRPHLHLVVNANDLPDTQDLSHGFFRRLLTIEWRFRADDSNRVIGLDRELLGELPGILNLALEGLDRLRKRDYQFNEPGASKEMKEDYRFDQDPIWQFLADCCECDPNRRDLFCNPTHLYRQYTEWCKSMGHSSVSCARFGTHLTKRLGYAKVGSKRRGSDFDSVRYGIRLLKEPVGDLDRLV